MDQSEKATSCQQTLLDLKAYTIAIKSRLQGLVHRWEQDMEMMGHITGSADKVLEIIDDQVQRLDRKQE